MSPAWRRAASARSPSRRKGRRPWLVRSALTRQTMASAASSAWAVDVGMSVEWGHWAAWAALAGLPNSENAAINETAALTSGRLDLAVVDMVPPGVRAVPLRRREIEPVSERALGLHLTRDRFPPSRLSAEVRLPDPLDAFT